MVGFGGNPYLMPEEEIVAIQRMPAPAWSHWRFRCPELVSECRSGRDLQKESPAEYNGPFFEVRGARGFGSGRRQEILCIDPHDGLFKSTG